METPSLSFGAHRRYSSPDKELYEEFVEEFNRINGTVRFFIPGFLLPSSWEFAKDIVIFINDHKIELISGGILTNAVYDIVKSFVKVLWRKLKRKKTDRITYLKSRPRFIIVVNDVELIIENFRSKEALDKILSSLDNFFATGQIINELNSIAKKRIRLKYNKRKKCWQIKKTSWLNKFFKRA